jgi:hypothetical protein
MGGYDDMEVQRRTILQAAGVVGALLVTGKGDHQIGQDDLAAARQQRATAEAQVAHLEDQAAAAANEPPSGYTVPNSADAIQATVDSGPVFLPNGDWLLREQLLNSDGFDVLLAPGATLWRTWDSSTATRAAMIANRVYDMAKPAKGFRLRGGHLASKPGMGGGVLAPYADDQEIRDITLDYWIGGRAFLGGGERPLHDNIKGASAPYDYNLGPDQPAGSGCGGWRWVVGGGGKITNMSLTSGDDGLQYVPSGSPADPFFNGPDIHDMAYEDCTVRSYKARPTVIGLQARNDPEGSTQSGMKSGVHRVAFRRIRGRTSGTPINIANHHSLGGISDVVFEDVVIEQDGLAGRLGQPHEIYVLTYHGLGDVTRIDLSGAKVIELTNSRLKPNGPKGYFGTKGPVGTVTPPAATA